MGLRATRADEHSDGGHREDDDGSATRGGCAHGHHHHAFSGSTGPIWDRTGAQLCRQAVSDPRNSVARDGVVDLHWEEAPATPTGWTLA